MVAGAIVKRQLQHDLTRLRFAGAEPTISRRNSRTAASALPSPSSTGDTSPSVSRKLTPRKIFVQRLGVDPAFWRPQNRCHSAHGLAILSVGRLHPAKNHGLLLLACKALKAQGVPFRCVIAGEGEERRSLERLIAALGSRTRGNVARRCALRENLPGLYAGADVFALTSRSEGLPVALMEAMAMERVVLAPEITGNS